MNSKGRRETKLFYLEERSLRGIQTSVSRRHNHIDRSYQANSSRCSNLFSIKSIQYYLIEQYPTNFPYNRIKECQIYSCNTLYLATSSRTSFKSPFVKMRPTFPWIKSNSQIHRKLTEIRNSLCKDTKIKQNHRAGWIYTREEKVMCTLHDNTLHYYKP